MNFTALANALVAAYAASIDEAKNLVKSMVVDAMARHAMAREAMSDPKNTLAYYETVNTDREIRNLVTLALLIGAERPMGHDVEQHARQLWALSRIAVKN